MKTKTRGKKVWIVPVIIAAAVAAAYFQVWYESYSRAESYFDDAMAKYEAGEYVSALKGERVRTEDGQGYRFSGGFQQVLETWDNPYAYPKPGSYAEAKAKIDEIIDEKLTAEEGQEAFKQYFKLDNRFLGRILIRIGDIYAEQGDARGAKEMYEMAAEAFPLDDAVVAESKKKAAALAGG